MTWQSRQPAVLDSLVALWSGVPELAGLVQDGPDPIEGAGLEALSVGHDGGEDGASTDGLITPEGFGVRPDREAFTVTCLVAVLNGAGDMAAARGRAYELLSHAAEALRSDHTLGGIVGSAFIQALALSQLQMETGAEARLLFTVACDGYTVR